MIDAVLAKRRLGPQAQIIVVESLYGCTKNLMESWERRGIRVHSLSVDEIGRKLDKLINPKTAIIYLESVTNPNLRIPDIEQVLRINRGRAAVLVDDTFATTEMFKTLAKEVKVGGKSYSVDMVMFGLTKGMSATGNVIAGAVTAKREWLKRLAGQRNCLPEAKEIRRALRGLRHLEIRFKAQSKNARALARWIAFIERVRGNNLVESII